MLQNIDLNYLYKLSQDSEKKYLFSIANKTKQIAFVTQYYHVFNAQMVSYENISDYENQKIWKI